MEINMGVQSAFVFTLLLNIILATSKMMIGMFLSWPSLISDGIHTLSDGLTNIVALGSIHYARKPKDDNHPYGHGRIESLAMLVIVAFLVYLSIEVFMKGWDQLINPAIITYHPLMIGIVGFSLGVNLIVVFIKFSVGKKHNHRLLMADAKHSFSDFLSTLLVAFGAIFVVGLKFDPRLDGILSMLIALLILKIAFDVFKESAKELLDEAIVDPKQIEAIACSHPLVHSIHEIRSRLSGQIVYVDFHAQSDPDLTLLITHELAHDLEIMIQKELGEHIHVIVHVEPLGHHYHHRSSF
jgi:cation diffusion facilitator family transporter